MERAGPGDEKFREEPCQSLTGRMQLPLCALVVHAMEMQAEATIFAENKVRAGMVIMRQLLANDHFDTWCHSSKALPFSF